MDLVLELMLRRFIELVDTGAGDIELPAVIDAAQTTLLVAAEEQRGAAGRAVLVEEPDATLRVAKGDEIFAQYTYAHRRCVGPRDLVREQRGNPVPPHRVAHRSTLSHPRDELVFFSRQHRRSSWLILGDIPALRPRAQVSRGIAPRPPAFEGRPQRV